MTDDFALTHQLSNEIEGQSGLATNIIAAVAPAHDLPRPEYFGLSIPTAAVWALRCVLFGAGLHDAGCYAWTWALNW